MNFEQYLKNLKNDAHTNFKDNEHSLLFTSNSLGGECGELQNLIKKVYRDDNGEPAARLPDMILELGDILWCWQKICDLLEVEPSKVMELNIEKLKSRGWLS